MASGDAIFKEFVAVETFLETLKKFRELCAALDIDPNKHSNLYRNIKSRLRTKEAEALWTLLDARASHQEYMGGKVCKDTKMLVIGSGPCGMRMAIEGALLGANVVVVEMRDSITRNNVLYLWQFAIHDLKSIGVKVFFPKFCTGSIHHVSIRRLQLVLVKIGLIVGVDIQTPVKFEQMIPPDRTNGGSWRVEVRPLASPVNRQSFNVIVAADGKTNSLKEFTRKCMRGKLSIAITANFKNRQSRADGGVNEIPGVINLKRPELFQALKQESGLDLENLVYFRDETHYFVMTARKKSLLDTKILKRDIQDAKGLLSSDNVNRKHLLRATREVAQTAWEIDNPFAQDLPATDWALNHHGQEDVAIFDFANLFQADFSCYAKERYGHKLLMCTVGDSLLEPFWPTGSGIARGFLGVLDAAWLIRNWFTGDKSDLELLAERESVFRILSQTMPEHLNKNYKKYTIDPKSRYVAGRGLPLRINDIQPHCVKHLYSTSDDAAVPITVASEVIVEPETETETATCDSADELLAWFMTKLEPYSDIVDVYDLCNSWQDGLGLCALIEHYRPARMNVRTLDRDDIVSNVQMAFEIIGEEFGVLPTLSVSDLVERETPDRLAMIAYLSNIHVALKDEDTVNALSNETPPRDRPQSDAKELYLFNVSEDERPHADCMTDDKPAVDVTETERNPNTEHVESQDRTNRGRLAVEEERQREHATGGPDRMTSLSYLACSNAVSQRLNNIQSKGSTGAKRAQFKDPPRIVRRPYEGESQVEYVMQDRMASLSYMACRNAFSQRMKGQPSQGSTGATEASLAKAGPGIVATRQKQARDPQQEQPSQGPRPVSANTEQDPGSDRMQSLAYQACQGSVAKRLQNLQPNTGFTKTFTKTSTVTKGRQKPTTVVGITEEPEPEETMEDAPLEPLGTTGGDMCFVCGQQLYLSEKYMAHGHFVHRNCHKCHKCAKVLHIWDSVEEIDDDGNEIFLCKTHATDRGAGHVEARFQDEPHGHYGDNAGELEDIPEAGWVIEATPGDDLGDLVTSEEADAYGDEISLSLLVQDNIQQTLEYIEQERENQERRGVELEKILRNKEKKGTEVDPAEMKEWMELCMKKNETDECESLLSIQIEELVDGGRPTAYGDTYSSTEEFGGFTGGANTEEPLFDFASTD